MTHTDAIALAHTDQGTGEAVLLLHAFPLDRSMWSESIEALAPHFRVIAPDLRGHGGSPAPAGPYLMADHVADTVALLDRLGVASVAVVGVSMGGYVAMNLLAAHPDRVWAAVLADTRAGADSDEGRRGRAEQARRVQAEGLASFIAQQLPKMFAPATLRDRPEVAARYTAIVQATRPAAIVAQLAGLAARPDTTAALERVTCPTLILVGAEDVLTPPAEAQAMAALVRGSQVEVLEGAGHLANLELPAQFNRRIVEFLRQHAAGLG